ncbi:MAG: hypothetical protein KDE24_30040, partial [Caldilinea sp.]|nr:hypothetical protein [Caldilinea sp.]
PITIDGLTMRDGYTNEYDGGGAIYAAGPLTVTGSSFVSNTVMGYDESRGHGGAISFAGSNTHALVISGTSFLSNTAAIAGGALSVANGTLVLDDSILTGNAAFGLGRWGGALICDTCGFTIDGATFSNNQAVKGGAFYITDKNIHYSIITGSTFQGNQAAPDGDGEGGAIYIDVYEGITITGTTVLSNAAGSGGGLYINSIGLDEGGLDLRNSQVAGNTAAAQGGGIFNQGWLRILEGTTFSANSAVIGGALYDVGWLSVSASSFFSNTAKNGGAITVDQQNTNAYIGSSVFGGNSSDCNGGALAAAAPVTVEMSELYGNQAGLACSELALGGAIYVENALWLTVSAVHDNVSAVAGGAIGILGNLNSPKTVEIRGSAIFSNSATMAGAVAIGGPSVTRIEQSSIYSNTATMVGGIASGYGGATIDIVNSTLAGNSSGYMASALLVAGGNALEDNAGFGPDTLTLRNVTIAGNDRLGINAQNGDGFGAFANTDVGGKTATVGITNTIIAGGANEQSCYTGPLAIGSVPAAVSNLDNDGTCGSNFTQSDTILLGPLGDYGAVLQSGSIGGATPVTPTLVVFPLLPG